jgi:lysophospholipase L1-like esterase
VFDYTDENRHFGGPVRLLSHRCPQFTSDIPLRTLIHAPGLRDDCPVKTSAKVPFLMAARTSMPLSHARWTPAWTASPQPVWSGGLPLAADLPENLHEVTIRQVIRAGYSGNRIRLLLSNRYGTGSVRLEAVGVAPSIQGSRIKAALNKIAAFGGEEAVLIPPAAIIASDPVALRVKQGDELAVSIRLVGDPQIGGFHWDGRRTGYIIAGNQLAAESPAVRAISQRRLFLAGLLVEGARPRGVVVAFGDSITDGAGATPDRDARWTDFLAARAARSDIAVVNAGISGARLLSDGMGASALARFDQDVLSQPGARTVILQIGINDIAWPGTPFAPNEPPMTFERMADGYRVLIERAHAANMRIVGSTLSPFADALPDTPMAATYYSIEKNALRHRINEWIQTSGAFDAVLDFDYLLKDPKTPDHLLPRYDGGDHLHPGDRGNQAMADALDVEVLLDPP